MASITVRSLESETSYLESDWSVFVLKELQDNAYNWLNEHYPAKSAKDKDIRKIMVRIWISREGISRNRFVHIAVRNSNVDNIPAFEDLSKTVDFSFWHSIKLNQHGTVLGSLGDALKRCLEMGYASWTSDYNPSETFEEKQWNKPMIIRSNGSEFRVFIRVDSSGQQIWAEVKPAAEEMPIRHIGNDTEVEVTLPLPSSISDEGNLIDKLVRYYRSYRIRKSRTDFSLELELNQPMRNQTGYFWFL